MSLRPAVGEEVTSKGLSYAGACIAQEIGRCVSDELVRCWLPPKGKETTGAFGRQSLAATRRPGNPRTNAS